MMDGQADSETKKTRLTRTFVAAPNGWRAIYEQEDGSLKEVPVACFVVAGRGNAEVFPLTSFAGQVILWDSGDYKGLIGPGQTVEQMLAEQDQTATSAAGSGPREGET